MDLFFIGEEFPCLICTPKNRKHDFFRTNDMTFCMKTFTKVFTRAFSIMKLLTSINKVVYNPSFEWSLAKHMQQNEMVPCDIMLSINFLYLIHFHIFSRKPLGFLHSVSITYRKVPVLEINKTQIHENLFTLGLSDN